MNRTQSAIFGVIAATTLAVTACGSSSSAGSAAAFLTPAAGGGSIIVGSANFTESVLLMDVYAEALRAEGVTVTTKPKIGDREVYIPAIKDGSIDLIPEYSGTLLAYLDATSKAASSSDIYAALPAILKLSGLEVLPQSQAEDRDAIAVSASSAAKYHLQTIADLAGSSGSLVIGAGPEFKTRADGVAGLKGTYGVTFSTFKTLDSGGPLTVAALKSGQIDAAALFTTDPSVPANKFVLLQDPKNLYTAQNVLPLIASNKVTPPITAALNAVSAELDTPILLSLDKQVYSGTDPDAVAKSWVKANLR